MANQYIGVPIDAPGGKKVDVSELAVGANTVERQRIVIASDTTDVGLAAVKNVAAVGTDYALVVRNVPSAGVAQDVNLIQIAGTAVLAGNGITGAGSQRVTVASDNTAFKVIPNDGTNSIAVTTASAAIAENTSTFMKVDAANYALDTAAVAGSQQVPLRVVSTALPWLKTDVATIAGTAPTTVGKLDVKGADGDVFVRQATATNLNAAVVGTGTAGAPAGNILTIQGVAAMTKLLVTPDSVALPANQSVNVAQINAITPLMGNGITGTGSQRVTVASDNTPFPIKVDQTTPGTTNAVSLAQIGATTIVTGGLAGTQGVGGPVANAVAPTGNPLDIGWDGTLTRRFSLTTTGVPNLMGNIIALTGVANFGAFTSSGNAYTAATQGYVYNGTTEDARKSSSLANLTPSTTLTTATVGAAFSEKGPRWSVFSAPASGTVASASIAAAVGVRHVVDCIAFSASASAATAAATQTINVRDGATGAGTVIWTYTAGAGVLALGGTAVAPFTVCGLNLVGTTNTAMTLEFVAGLTGLIESASISGYNVN